MHFFIFYFILLQIKNTTKTTLEVGCIAGFDGGMEQHFVIEVFKTVNNSQVQGAHKKDFF